MAALPVKKPADPVPRASGSSTAPPHPSEKKKKKEGASSPNRHLRVLWVRRLTWGYAGKAKKKSKKRKREHSSLSGSDSVRAHSAVLQDPEFRHTGFTYIYL